jgi:hypothetical protein
MNEANGYDLPHITLERRLTNVVGDSAAPITAAKLRALLDETEAAIVEAEELARLAKDAAADPTITPDVTAARKQMEDASLRAGRLQTLLTRLQRRYAELADRERRQQWEQDFAELEKQRDDIALAFDEQYPDFINGLVYLLTHLAAFDRKADHLHGQRPAGVARHLDNPELMARGLNAFSRDTPSLLTLLQLYDLHGQRVWPPVVPRDMTIFAPVVDPRASKDWWKFAESDAAHAKAESERVQEYYDKQRREREERDKQQRKS